MIVAKCCLGLQCISWHFLIVKKYKVVFIDFSQLRENSNVLDNKLNIDNENCALCN